jgi:heptosyltransferase-2
MQAVAQASQSRPISLASAARDLSTLKALVEGAALVLVGDSGPRWVAAAFGTPCVSILGPNIPQLTATSLEQCEIVRLEDLECSPCARRTCPLGHHRCMRELPPERVVEAAARVLSRKGAA